MKRNPRTPEQLEAERVNDIRLLLKTWAEGDAEDKAMIRNIVPFLFDEDGKPLPVKAE